MGVAREQRTTDTLSVYLAGLQAGMAAALFMLAWLGLAAVWRQSSFWTAENLWASTFYGASAIRSGFSTSTLSGTALYLLVYSTLGGLFAAAVRAKFPGLTLLLAGVAVAAGWYYVSFHVIWHTINPLVSLLHAERPTLVGHVIYGAALAGFPRYLPAAAPVPPALAPALAAAPEPEPEPAPHTPET
jgi:hypothetical protein